MSAGRTRPEGDGGRGVVFPAAFGPFPHGCFSGIVEQCANVASGPSKARLLVAVQACNKFRLAQRDGQITMAPSTVSLAAFNVIYYIVVSRSLQIDVDVWLCDATELVGFRLRQKGNRRLPEVYRLLQLSIYDADRIGLMGMPLAPGRRCQLLETSIKSAIEMYSYDIIGSLGYRLGRERGVAYSKYRPLQLLMYLTTISPDRRDTTTAPQKGRRSRQHTGHPFPDRLDVRFPCPQLNECIDTAPPMAVLPRLTMHGPAGEKLSQVSQCV